MNEKGKKKRSGEPLLTISAVAEMFDLHQQTLRKYEEEGLMTPRRTAGGTRMFGVAEVKRIRTIVSLSRELGVNMAGVAIVLEQLDRIEEMKRLMELVLSQLDDPLRHRIIALLQGVEEGLVPTKTPGGGLMRQRGAVNDLGGEE
jgi:MerR family transcriptional regulator/heat shock protein HspR